MSSSAASWSRIERRALPCRALACPAEASHTVDWIVPLVTARLRPKANCYRVLLSATRFVNRKRTYWWPIIDADTPEEARSKAEALFGGGTGRTWEEPRADGNERGPGLPLRALVTVLEVILLHPASIHDPHGHDPWDRAA